MPQKRLSYTKHRLLWLLVLLVGFLAVAILVWFFFFRESDPTKSYHPKYSVSSSESQSKNNESTPQTESDNKGSNSSSVTTDITSEQVPVASAGHIAIDDLEQKDGYVNAKASVLEFTPTQCVYSFTAQDARPVVRQQNGTCDGISIPQGEFELIGIYRLTVTAYNGTSEKISASKDIEVK